MSHVNSNVQGNLIPQGELKAMFRLKLVNLIPYVQGNLIPQGELKVLGLGFLGQPLGRSKEI